MHRLSSHSNKRESTSHSFFSHTSLSVLSILNSSNTWNWVLWFDHSRVCPYLFLNQSGREVIPIHGVFRAKTSSDSSVRLWVFLIAPSLTGLSSVWDRHSIVIGLTGTGGCWPPGQELERGSRALLSVMPGGVGRLRVGGWGRSHQTTGKNLSPIFSCPEGPALPTSYLGQH